MTRQWLVVGPVAVSLWLTAAAVHAQDEGPGRIPANIITTTKPLTAEQNKTVDGYINHWVQTLTEGDDKEVVDARQHLRDPIIQAGDTHPVFRNVYQVKVAKRLPPAAKSDRLIVQINAMLLAGEVADPLIFDVVGVGLEDKSAAVRMAAAQAFENLVANIDLKVNQKVAVSRTAIKTLHNETSGWVLEHLYNGLTDLELNEAFEAVLDKLNQRVALYGMRPQTHAGADTTGLNKLFIKLLSMFAGGTKVPTKFISRLALVSCRYLDMSATLRDTHRVEGHVAKRLERLADEAAQALEWAVKTRLDQAGVTGVKIPESAKGKPPALQRVIANDYKLLLKDPKLPFKFEEKDLQIAIKPPKQAP